MLTTLFRFLAGAAASQAPAGRIISSAAYRSAAVNPRSGRFAQWDTITRQFPIYSAGTTPAVLTAPTGVYFIAASPSAPSALIAKTGVLTQSLATGLWTMSVPLSEAETGGLSAGQFYEQASVQDADGSNEMIYSALLTIIPALPPSLAG